MQYCTASLALGFFQGQDGKFCFPWIGGSAFGGKKSGGKIVDVTETSQMISTDKVIEDKWKRKQKL